MSDIGGFGLPGFHTGGRKLRVLGTVPASSDMLLASQTNRLLVVRPPASTLAGILMINTLTIDETDHLEFLLVC